jgi:hypothetical protein
VTAKKRKEKPGSKMAKSMKKRPPDVRSQTAPPALAAGVPRVTRPVPFPAIPTIAVPAASALTVIVDVGPMTVPFTLALNGQTIVKSLVDHAEDMPLVQGRQILGWAFAHAGPGWHHTIAFAIDGGPPTVLESRSEAKRDQDHSVGFAIVNKA